MTVDSLSSCPPTAKVSFAAAISADQVSPVAPGPGPFPRGLATKANRAAGTDDLRTSTKNQLSVNEKAATCHSKIGERDGRDGLQICVAPTALGAERGVPPQKAAVTSEHGLKPVLPRAAITAGGA